MSARELLAFAAIAQPLGVDVNTIRRWVRTEQCPVVVVGRKRRTPAAWGRQPRAVTSAPARA